MFPKDHQRVVILFHTTRGAFYRGLEPGCDTLVVKNMFTFEFFVCTFCHFKTHCTCAEKVCTTLAVLYRLLLALGPVQGQSGTIHFLLK